MNRHWEKLPDKAKDLVLFGKDDPNLENNKYQIKSSIRANMKKGKYDPEEAKKAWGFHADATVRKYHMQHGSRDTKWHTEYSPQMRKQLAGHFEAEHRHEMKEELENVGKIVEAAMDKKPLLVEQSFIKLVLNKIETLVNEKRESMKGKVFNIDEISKGLASRYIVDASMDKSHKAHEIGKQNVLGQAMNRPRDKDFHDAQKKHKNRSGGIQVALGKLVGKNNEQGVKIHAKENSVHASIKDED
jgi:hypothetical protein